MFYYYSQNNSGGWFEIDPLAGIGCNVIIEADNFEEANARAEKIGLYFDGVEEGYDCECCGDRWYELWREEGTEIPMINGRPASEYEPIVRWAGDNPDLFIHYKSGIIDRLMAY